MLISSHNKFTFDFEGEEYLKDIVKQGQGGILISGHIGNWEVAGSLLKRIEGKINIVMYMAEAEKLQNYLNKISTNKIPNIIGITDDLEHIYKIQEHLARGEIIVMHGDRFVKGARTKLVDFIDKKALFPLGPFYLASIYKVPISFVFAMKEKKSHYHFYATKPHIYQGKEQQNKPLVDFLEIFEKMAKKYPVQWFNYYNFWK